MTFKSEYAEGTFTSRSPNSHKKRGFGSQNKEVLQSLSCPLDKQKLHRGKKGQFRWVVRWGEYYFYLSFQVLRGITG